MLLYLFNISFWFKLYIDLSVRSPLSVYSIFILCHKISHGSWLLLFSVHLHPVSADLTLLGHIAFFLALHFATINFLSAYSCFCIHSHSVCWLLFAWVSGYLHFKLLSSFHLLVVLTLFPVFALLILSLFAVASFLCFLGRNT